MMLSRRRFFGLVAAPAIVRATSLMPIAVPLQRALFVCADFGTSPISGTVAIFSQRSPRVGDMRRDGGGTLWVCVADKIESHYSTISQWLGVAGNLHFEKSAAGYVREALEVARPTAAG